MQPQPFIAALPLLFMVSVPLLGAENTITEYSAPSGTPTGSPPAPFTDAQFAYQYFTPTASDPQRNNLHYRLFTPPSYSTSGSAKHPLVFFLHGDGEKEDGTIRNQAQMRDNGQYAFCTTTDQAILPCFYALVQTSWYARDGGSQTAVDLTAALCAKYRIDPDRVFVTGLSGGGGATLSWAGQKPGNWAGFVALSAPSPGAAGAYQPGNLATIPSWFFAANDDRTVGPGNQTGQMLDLRSRGGRPIYTLYNNGGHSKNTWGSAYGTKALITWMAGLRRGQPAQQPVEVAITSPTTSPTLVSAATSTGLAGTTTDRQLSGASSGITSVSWFAGTNGPQAAGGSIASWSSTTNQTLAAGSTYVVATASGSSFDSNRGGTTTYCDVMLVDRSVGTNAAPVAHAGSDVAVTLPTSAALSGSATDDGLPSGSSLTYAWSKVSGPGTVTFTAGTSAATGAGFSAAGTYVLRLTASDGALSGTDDLTITVNPATTGGGSNGAVVQIDFGSEVADGSGNGGLTTGNWNNIYGNSSHLSVGDCIDATGAATGISAVAAGFAGWPESTNGIASSALFPLTAQSDFFSVTSGTATVTLTGLDATATYDVVLFASRKYSAPTTAFTIGGVTRTLACAGNTSTTVAYKGLSTTGTLIIAVAPGTGSSEGLLSALTLTRHSSGGGSTPVDTAPAVNSAIRGNDSSRGADQADQSNSCGLGGGGIALIGLSLLGLRARRRDQF